MKRREFITLLGGAAGTWRQPVDRRCGCDLTRAILRLEEIIGLTSCAQRLRPRHRRGRPVRAFKVDRFASTAGGAARRRSTNRRDGLHQKIVAEQFVPDYPLVDAGRELDRSQDSAAGGDVVSIAVKGSSRDRQV